MPDNLRYLSENVDRNGLGGRTRLVGCAVRAAVGRVRMEEASHGSSRVANGRAAEDTALLTVEALPLDRILTDHECDATSVALVWCDAEGSETEVVASGVELWKNGVPLFAEVNPRQLSRISSLDAFCTAICEHFSRFVPADELVQHGANAACIPASDLRSVAGDVGDVLLLPYDC